MSEDQGLPLRMRARCESCGERYVGGTVSVWLEKGESGYVNQPRSDVSFRCLKGCDGVCDMEIKILERAEPA